MAKFLYPDVSSDSFKLLLGAIHASPSIYAFLAPMGSTHFSHICRRACQAAHIRRNSFYERDLAPLGPIVRIAMGETGSILIINFHVNEQHDQLGLC